MTRQWVDENDCSLMSDDFAAEGYASPEEGMRACEEDDDPGLQAGQYTVESVEIRDRRAEVRLALKPAGERTFELVKGGPTWEIDAVSNRFRGELGDTFPYRDAYELNGSPVEVDAELTVAAIKDPPRPNADAYLPEVDEKRGHRWVRARVQVKSTGRDSFDFIASDFSAADTSGQRYEPDFEVFEPALGDGTLSLSEGDTVTGYVGFHLPDEADLAEIRFAPSGVDPLVWKLD